MEKMNDLQDLLKHEIEDLQSAEEQIIEALPKMIEKASNPDLKKALQEHLQITEQHKARIEKIMQQLSSEGGESNRKKGILAGLFGSGKHVCKGMKGIIEEGETIVGSNISSEARDAAIIASAQKVEHYEICGYGTARTFAMELGLDQIARQLQQTLNEEYEADDLLTNLAVMRINEEAENAGDGSASASSGARSAGSRKEKAGREVEMEPVRNSRSGSSGRNESAGSGSKKNSGNTGAQPKTSGAPRGETARSSSSKTSSSRASASGTRGSQSSGRGNGGSSAGRGNAKSNSRGRR